MKTFRRNQFGKLGKVCRRKYGAQFAADIFRKIRSLKLPQYFIGC